MSYREVLTVTIGITIGMLIMFGGARPDYFVAFFLFIMGLWVANSQEV